MSVILGTIDAWWTRHPHAAELILFAGAAFISLFTGIVRQALFIPVRYSAVGLLRITQKRARRELEIIKLIDDSAFMLIAYLGYYIIHELLWSFGTSFIVFLLMESFIPAQRNLPPALLFSLLFFGGFTARLLNLYGLLGNFLNRDKAVKQLEDIVAGRPLSQTTR